MKRIIFSVVAVTAIALTSCKKDTVESTELGEATINGTVRSNIDQTNDMNEVGLYVYNYNPENVEGMTVKVEVDTEDWQQSPESGYTYDKKVFTAVTNAEGKFTLTIPATEEGYTISITFEDKFGITRKMYTNDGSVSSVESYVYRGSDNVFIYSGAAINNVYDASIAAVNNNETQFGSAKVMGTVRANYNQGMNPGGYEVLGSSSPFPGKEVVITYTSAPYGIGNENSLKFTVDANGNYVADVPTRLINDGTVAFYLGMYDFTGNITGTNAAGTADSTWSGVYSVGGNPAYREYRSNVTDGQIITGVNFNFNGQPIF